jgi:hypothetical protein
LAGKVAGTGVSEYGCWEMLAGTGVSENGWPEKVAETWVSKYGCFGILREQRWPNTVGGNMVVGEACRNRDGGIWLAGKGCWNRGVGIWLLGKFAGTRKSEYGCWEKVSGTGETMVGQKKVAGTGVLEYGWRKKVAGTGVSENGCPGGKLAGTGVSEYGWREKVAGTGLSEYGCWGSLPEQGWWNTVGGKVTGRGVSEYCVRIHMVSGKRGGWRNSSVEMLVPHRNLAKTYEKSGKVQEPRIISIWIVCSSADGNGWTGRCGFSCVRMELVASLYSYTNIQS